MFFFFFFNDTATTEIYTLSLHDALPICEDPDEGRLAGAVRAVEAEDHAFRDLQVDSGEGRCRPEPLEDALDPDRGRPLRHRRLAADAAGSTGWPSSSAAVA